MYEHIVSPIAGSPVLLSHAEDEFNYFQFLNKCIFNSHSRSFCENSFVIRVMQTAMVLHSGSTPQDTIYEFDEEEFYMYLKELLKSNSENTTH